MRKDRKIKARIYWQRGHAYADFRDFWAEGGRREALKVPGERHATTDPKLAEALAAKRLTDLTGRRARRRGNAVAGLPAPTSLETFAAEHLVAKQKAGKVTAQYMGEEQMRLQRAIEFFGADTDLSSIKVAHVREWNEALTTMGLSGGTRRHHLNRCPTCIAGPRPKKR